MHMKYKFKKFLNTYTNREKKSMNSTFEKKNKATEEPNASVLHLGLNVEMFDHVGFLYHLSGSF